MLGGLFDARRVAVIGVSPRPGNLGKTILDHLHNMKFCGEAISVGHQGGETEHGPIYATIDEVPGRIDLAIIMVPARFVPDALDACGRKAVPWAIVSSAGFAEIGEDGHELDRQLTATAKRYGTRFVGPNCLGVVDWVSGLNSSFAAPPLWTYKRGPVAIVSQSGGMADALSNYVSELGPGLNKYISIGNCADVDEVDCLAYLAEDPSTEIICMYLEGLHRARELVEVAKHCRKPILVHKANASEAGARAAKSHTAVMASNDTLVDAAFAQAGILRVRGLRNMALTANIMRLPRMKGNRVAAVALSGGMSVILGDTCEEEGLTLPLLDQGLLREIESRSRAGVIRLTNPLDTGDIFDNKLFVELVERVAKLPYVDCLVVAFPLRDPRPGEGLRSEGGMVASRIKEICQETGKPIALSKMPSPKTIGGLMRELDFPVFSDPEEATHALGALWRYSQVSRNKESA